MKQHPTQEQWMEFIYDELDTPRKRVVQQHLNYCADCQLKKSELDRTKKSLDTWRVTVPARHQFQRNWMPAVKWAAAAAVLVTTAFATGRMSRPELDIQALQAQITKPIQESVERDVQAKMKAELQIIQAETEKVQAQIALQVQNVSEKTMNEALAAAHRQIDQLAATVATLREEDQRAIFASIQRLQAQQMAEYRRLRKNLETVAVLTDQNLKDAQRKIVQLASYSTTPTVHQQ
jgi:hypothetical protein